MKKGKIIAIILSMCVLGLLGKNILVSMASYKYGGFRNVKNTTNSTTSNEDITESINTVDSVEQNVNMKEENITTDMLSEQLGSTALVTLDSASQVESYLTSNGMSYNKSEDDYSSVDNSNSKYFPPIADQGSINSCTAWSTVYYQMAYAVNKALDRDGSDKNNQMSPIWVYNMINGGENKGTYYTDALKILSEIGAVPYRNVYSYISASDTNIRNIAATKENWLEARKYRVKEYYTFDLGNDSKIRKTQIYNPKSKVLKNVKIALANGEIITCTTYTTKCWKRAVIEENPEVPENSKYVGEKIVPRHESIEGQGCHRVTRVGYNDNIWVDINENGKVEEGEKGAFKLANSYGKSYDNKGFFWVSYDALNRLSSVNSNKEQVDLNLSNRKPALFSAIGYTVDVDPSDSKLFLELDLSTEKASTVEIHIKATSKENGKKYEYDPVPFANSGMVKNLGDYPFNSNTSNSTFMIDLSNVISKVNKNDIVRYNWEITVTDNNDDGNKLTVNSAKFYDVDSDKYYNTNLEKPVSIDNNFTIITSGNEADYSTVYTNKAIYSFVAEESKEFVFSTPLEYADKRYYEIYVLDEPFSGNIKDIANSYKAKVITKNGTGSIDIKKGQYVYCIAKNKSAWDGFIYRNSCRLSIQVK